MTACDIRYCSEDTRVTVKEVDIGMAADLGTLQRFPKVIGNSAWGREMVYTGRYANAAECCENGLFSRVFASKEECVDGAVELARVIAEKSPVAIVGIKKSLNYSRDHTVEQGLDFIRLWNSFAVQTEDLMNAVMASMQKTTPIFSKL